LRPIFCFINQKTTLITRICTFFILLFFGLTGLALAQDSSRVKKKGTFYFSWGYNRDAYTKSDIRFVNKKNDNYDFTFIHASAHDKPTMYEWWHIDRLTIPQYDLHIGYFFNDKHDLGIEFGWNHLKYWVTDNQVIHVRGEIRGKSIDKDTLVTPSFVHLQHTNGNNYALINLVKRQRLWVSKNFQLSAIGKIGAGPLISYTISSVLGANHSTGFQYQGWVIATSAGLRFNLYKYFFIQGDVQGAFANYTDSKIGTDGQGRSTQHFYSVQYLWAGGLNFPLGQK
jgi:hypothetical protein